MQGLDDIASDIESRLNEKEEVREVALKSSRTIVRMCGMAIRAMHLGNDPVPDMDEATEELHKLIGITRDFPDLMHSGIVESAMQEYVEVKALYAYTKDQPLPSHGTLNVTPEAYILGIGDLIGEIRRLALDNIRKGAVDGAAGHLDNMEKFYDFLMNFNYPDSMVAVRRKQDIARGILEKTRGDVTNAIRSFALEKKLAEKR
jgi:translin